MGARKLGIVIAALAIALIGTGMQSAGATPRKAGGTFSVAAAVPNCPNRFGAIGVPMPSVTYTTDDLLFPPATTIAIPGMCAYSNPFNGNRWVGITGPDDQPAPPPVCTNRFDPHGDQSKIVSGPSGHFGKRRTSLLTRCDVYLNNARAQEGVPVRGQGPSAPPPRVQQRFLHISRRRALLGNHLHRGISVPAMDEVRVEELTGAGCADAA